MKVKSGSPEIFEIQFYTFLLSMKNISISLKAGTRRGICVINVDLMIRGFE